MPVRKIPKNHLSVTGSFASRKNGKMGGFESILEKEYLLLLDFDDEVESFEEQPINIPITGIARGYTPDVLVHFRADSETGQTRPPLLTEIKHSSDLKRNAEKYAPKFAAAEQYVAERGWEFRTTTEKEIRTPRLANLKFLREYRKRASHSIGRQRWSHKLFKKVTERHSRQRRREALLASRHLESDTYAATDYQSGCRIRRRYFYPSPRRCAMKKKEPTQLWLREGATVSDNGRNYIILALADINLVLAKEVGSGEKVLLKIGDIGPPKTIEQPPSTQLAVKPNLWEISDADWQIAEERRRHIEPLLIAPSHQHAGGKAEKIAVAAGVSRPTIYRWVAAFRQTGLLSSLLPTSGLRGGKGQSRLSPEVEAIIADCLENFHDTEQNASIASTVEEIRRLCSNAQLQLPALNTIRVRIERTNGRERIARRKGEAAAHDQFDPIKGVIPDTDWPLALVQIDHTLLPVIIVDDIYRKSIRRACVSPMQLCRRNNG